MVSNVKTIGRLHGKGFPQVLQVVRSPQKKSAYSRVYSLFVHDSGRINGPPTDRYGII